MKYQQIKHLFEGLLLCVLFNRNKFDSASTNHNIEIEINKYTEEKDANKKIIKI